MTKPGYSCKTKFCARRFKRRTSHLLSDFGFCMNVCINYQTSITVSKLTTQNLYFQQLIA